MTRVNKMMKEIVEYREWLDSLEDGRIIWKGTRWLIWDKEVHKWSEYFGESRTDDKETENE